MNQVRILSHNKSCCNFVIVVVVVFSSMCCMMSTRHFVHIKMARNKDSKSDIREKSMKRKCAHMKERVGNNEKETNHTHTHLHIYSLIPNHSMKHIESRYIHDLVAEWSMSLLLELCVCDFVFWTIQCCYPIIGLFTAQIFTRNRLSANK